MPAVPMCERVEAIPKTMLSLNNNANRVFPEETLDTGSIPSKSKQLQASTVVSSAVLQKIAVPFKAALESTASTFSELKDIATSDRRKIAHPLKVALALTITAVYVSLVHNDEFIGHNGIWAVMTVVVIFEFTAGASYCKGVNRTIGTFLASALVLGISQFAMLWGPSYQRIVTCISIFTVGTAATFLRFVPKVKAKYDYGVLIFILTFSLLMITSRNINPLDTASSRLYMVAVGCCVSLATSTFIYPIWAGEELHNSVSKNFDKLADSIEGSICHYTHPLDVGKVVSRNDDDSIHKNYRALTSCAASEESLANFATWEPPHGRFSMVSYPWSHYVRIGKALRHCTYTAMALHGCLTSEAQASTTLRDLFQSRLEDVAREAGLALREVGQNLKNMHKNRPTDVLLYNVKHAAEELQRFMDSHSDVFVTFKWPSMSAQCSPNRILKDYDIVLPTSSVDKVLQSDPVALGMPRSFLSVESTQSASNFSLATVISLLVETVARLEHVVEVVDQLGIVARFPEVKHVVIDIDNTK